MRIVHLANHAQNVGNGIVNVMVDLACQQAHAGHDVTVASSGGGFEPLLARHRVAHVRLPQAPRLRLLPGMLSGFGRLAARLDPDVVHAHMMSGALLARFGTLRKRYALVTTVHNEFQRTAVLMRVGDRVVAVTHAVADAMQRRGIPAARLAVVRNGTIGTARFDGAPAAPAPGLARPNVVTVAGLYSRKGIGDLIHAFARIAARFPDAHLYVLGDGPERAVFEALVDELGLAARVHLLGFVADPRPYLQEADIFVLASWREAAGLVLCEARAAGCAIVATNVDGIPEMLDDGRAGRLVPARDPAALANEIAALLADPAARAALAGRAREGLDAFHVQRVYDGYHAVYDAALAGLRVRVREPLQVPDARTTDRVA